MGDSHARDCRIQETESQPSKTNSLAVQHNTTLDPMGGCSQVHCECEDSKAKMETLDESDEDGNLFLRQKKRAFKVDTNTYFKKLKWKVGMTSTTIQKFKDTVVKFTLAQGYDLKFIYQMQQGKGLKQRAKIRTISKCMHHGYEES